MCHECVGITAMNRSLETLIFSKRSFWNSSKTNESFVSGSFLTQDEIVSTTSGARQGSQKRVYVAQGLGGCVGTYYSVNAVAEALRTLGRL